MWMLWKTNLAWVYELQENLPSLWPLSWIRWLYICGGELLLYIPGKNVDIVTSHSTILHEIQKA